MDGEIVEVAPESGQNNSIAGKLAVPEYWIVDWDRLDPLIIVRDFEPQTKQSVEWAYRQHPCGI